ncbi:MAG: hypothetical protein BGO55_16695 [Sphingobacteriales bacterium 50-39]|nr:hypothetical protein [Sphingobacteriales bacterium]OJW60118.1 MAG: hypothetical protein BGO55_16695 [Sphingobacteriales bacterium 50-39]
MINLSQLLIPLLWAGMTAGISFIEAPLKFRAPGITIPLGLGIGRLVFRALNKVEWIFYSLWTVPWFITQHTIPFIPLLIGMILLLQTFWWLPHLDKRASLIRQGQTPQGRSLHIYYASAEVLKFFLLVAYGCIYTLNHKI